MFRYLVPENAPVVRKASGGRPTDDPATDTEYDWSLRTANVLQAWRLFGPRLPGAGVQVGHPDTGYTLHPELADSARLLVSAGYDYDDDDPDPVDDLNDGFLDNPSHGTGTGSVIVSGVSRKVCTTFGIPFEVSGDRDLELIEQSLLLGRGLGHTAEPNLSPVRRGEDDVGALQGGELRQGVRRRQTRAAAPQQMFQRDPERVPEKGDEEMRLHAPLQLMEHRPNRQLAFQGAEGRFCLGQLDVLRPQLFDGLPHEIGAQQVGALARVAPGAPVFDELPVEPQLAVCLADGHLVQIGDAGVRGLQATQHALDLRAVFQPTGGDPRLQPAQAMLEPGRKAAPNRQFLLAPRRRST